MAVHLPDADVDYLLMMGILTAKNAEVLLHEGRLTCLS